MNSTVTEAEAQIRQLMAERTQAFHDADADLLASHYSADAVTYDLDPPLRHTAEQLRDPSRTRDWFATFEGSVDLEERDLTLVVGADVAFCHSLTKMSATAKGQGPFEMWFRSTVGFRRDGSRWEIVHEHTSTPFYMDGSFLAATDLTP